MAKESKIGMSEDQKKNIDTHVTLLSKKFKAEQVRCPSRIEEVSLKWLRDAPFYSEFLLKFNYFLTNGVPTMGVNSKKGFINLYINPAFMNGHTEENPMLMPKIDPKTLKPIFVTDSKGNIEYDEFGSPKMEMEEWPGLNDAELEGVLVHEIMHLIRCHHERAREDAYIWNIAADMLINNDIEKSKIGTRQLKLPSGAVYLKMAKMEGYKGEEVSEPLYEWLIEERKKYQNPTSTMMKGKSSGQQGKGSGGVGTPGKGDEQGDGDQDGPGNAPGLFEAIYGSKIDYHEAMEDNDGLTEAALKDIIDTAKIKGYGLISGDMTQTLDRLTKPSRTSWKQILRKNLSSFINSPGPFQESNWARRNRRGLPLPGVKKLDAKLVIAVDTSGSIGTAELTAFFTEVEKIVKDISQIILIQCDAKIQDVRESYKKGDWRKITVKGRGGTIVQPVFDYMVEHKLEKHPLVYFTDGEFSFDFDTKRIKTFWCIFSAYGRRDKIEVPKGTNIYIDTHEAER